MYLRVTSVGVLESCNYASTKTRPHRYCGWISVIAAPTKMQCWMAGHHLGAQKSTRCNLQLQMMVELLVATCSSHPFLTDSRRAGKNAKYSHNVK